MPKAYLNGHWIDDAQLSVPIGDLGFLMGVTVTERLRTFAREPFRQREHVDRMRRSLEVVGLPAAEIAAEVDGAIRELVQRNGHAWREDDDWAIVAFATPGEPGGEPTRCVHAHPLRFAEWAHMYDEGVHVVISDVRQTPATCWPPDLKCRSRMHYYLADLHAQERWPGARAVLLDQEGYLCESTTANLVLYSEGEGLVTPKLSKALPGVSVGVVEELAENLGVPFSQRDLAPSELAAADEAWLCSTSVCMLPVTRCNGKDVGHAYPGGVYREFLAAWSALVGVDVAAQARRWAGERSA